jgi:hypothetical protein
MADAAESFRDVGVGYPAQDVSRQPQLIPRRSSLDVGTTDDWSNRVNVLYDRVRKRTSDALQSLGENSTRVARTARNRVAQIRNERPLELLAVLGGVGVFLGIVTRIRRSRHHA